MLNNKFCLVKKMAKKKPKEVLLKQNLLRELKGIHEELSKNYGRTIVDGLDMYAEDLRYKKDQITLKRISKNLFQAMFEMKEFIKRAEEMTAIHLFKP